MVKQLSERLVRLGHEVVVATKKHPDRTFSVLNGVTIVDFNIEGNLVRGITGDKDVYRDFLLDSDFDIVTNFAAQQWATDIALPILQKIKGKKVNVPTGFSGFYEPSYKSYFENMKEWMKGYDLNIFLSDDYRDINFARENGIDNNVIVPNGAGADEFSRDTKTDIRKKFNIAPDCFLILHVGSFTNIKGHMEALEIFFKSRIKNATLLMIGFNNDLIKKAWRRNLRLIAWRVLNFLCRKKAVITFVNREETVDAYKAADLFLFPSNVECSPIVLFECMASKTPFLTTDVGNSAEIIGWSNAGVLLPTDKDHLGMSHARIDESAGFLEKIYKDTKMREGLVDAGYEAWKKKFSWEVISLQYEQLYESLLKTPLR